MGMGDGYLNPGLSKGDDGIQMKYDFAVYNVPGSPHGKGVMITDVDKFVEEWCKKNFKFSYFFLGRGTSDWAIHVQLSHPQDVDTLRRYCDCKVETGII